MKVTLCCRSLTGEVSAQGRQNWMQPTSSRGRGWTRSEEAGTPKTLQFPWASLTLRQLSMSAKQGVDLHTSWHSRHGRCRSGRQEGLGRYKPPGVHRKVDRLWIFTGHGTGEICMYVTRSWKPPADLCVAYGKYRVPIVINQSMMMMIMHNY